MCVHVCCRRYTQCVCMCVVEDKTLCVHVCCRRYTHCVCMCAEDVLYNVCVIV